MIEQLLPDLVILCLGREEVALLPLDAFSPGVLAERPAGGSYDLSFWLQIVPTRLKTVCTLACIRANSFIWAFHELIYTVTFFSPGHML